MAPIRRQAEIGWLASLMIILVSSFFTLFDGIPHINQTLKADRTGKHVSKSPVVLPEARRGGVVQEKMIRPHHWG